METDASSKVGWGGVCMGQEAEGHWSEWEKTLHINVLELLAAFFGVEIFLL